MYYRKQHKRRVQTEGTNISLDMSLEMWPGGPRYTRGTEIEVIVRQFMNHYNSSQKQKYSIFTSREYIYTVAHTIATKFLNQKKRILVVYEYIPPTAPCYNHKATKGIEYDYTNKTKFADADADVQMNNYDIIMIWDTHHTDKKIINLAMENKKTVICFNGHTFRGNLFQFIC